MKIETLKKSHKKQIAIGAIAVCVVGGALTFATTRAKYRVTQDIPLVSGTVNYKAYDFKVMAMYKSDDGINYSEITDKRMPGSDYVINTGRSYCTPDNVNKDTSAVLKTEHGEHKIENLQKSDKCHLWFDKVKITNSTTLIENSKINVGSPDFNQIATTDEGIYQTIDGMYGGMSYYWRGVATTNHLIFANKCWRIVRINGDKSIRIIYNGSVKGTASNPTCAGNGANADSIAVANQAYSASVNNSSYVGWTYKLDSQRPDNNALGTESNAKTQTEAWYSSNIANNGTSASKVVDGKFCNDRNVDSPALALGWTNYTTTWVATETQFTYASSKRLHELFALTLGCNAVDIYTLKAGAITADEVELAGGRGDNNLYYLYNGQKYWTMTPVGWRAKSSAVAYVHATGTIHDTNSDAKFGLRPVINLRKEVTFSKGNGTSSSPYVVS